MEIDHPEIAVADTEFVPVGAEVVGRQSQTWVRTDDGWAHRQFARVVTMIRDGRPSAA